MTVVIGAQKSPNWLIRLLWFVFLGWWIGQLWIAVAWFLMTTIIGIPFGVMMLNKLPQLLTLRVQSPQMGITVVGGVVVVSGGAVPQYNFLLRALYFFVIGWWLSALWIELAYLICLTVIGLPVGFWMFDRVPALVSLRR